MPLNYKLLNTTGPGYTPSLWSMLEDLYVGGFQIASHAERYIRKELNEQEERYRARLESASYLNYLGLICDNFANGVFAKDVAVTPAVAEEQSDDPYRGLDRDYWTEFEKNADLKGATFAKILKDAFATAILKKRAIVACDFPRVGGAASNRAQEDASGANRGYCFEVPLEQMLDWEYGDVVERTVDIGDGARVTYTVSHFAWATLKRTIRRRESPEDTRGKVVEEFKVWRMVDGFATWELYRTKPREEDERFADDYLPPIVAEGTTTFREIPLLELEMPHALWVGNRIGTLVLEHFRRRSALVAAQNRSLFAIAVAYLGPEVGALGAELPSEAQQDPNRGYDPVNRARRDGFLVMGKDDKIAFEEPEGKAYELTDKQLSALVDEIFRVGQQIASSVSSTSTALGRSGLSKTEDNRMMTTALRAFGAVVKDFGARIHDTISVARKEVAEWAVHGLDSYESEDVALVLEQAVQASTLGIPSRTFLTHYRTKLALSLLGNTATPETKAMVTKEISEGTSVEETRPPQIVDDETDAPPPKPGGKNPLRAAAEAA